MATNPDPNGGAFDGPYIDPAITIALPPDGAFGRATPLPAFNAVPAPEPAPAKSGSTTQGATTAYDPVTAAGVDTADHEPNNAGAVPPAGQPLNDIVSVDVVGDVPRTRDPYREDGMVGQDFFKKAV